MSSRSGSAYDAFPSLSSGMGAENFGLRQFETSVDRIVSGRPSQEKPEDTHTVAYSSRFQFFHSKRTSAVNEPTVNDIATREDSLVKAWRTVSEIDALLGSDFRPSMPTCEEDRPSVDDSYVQRLNTELEAALNVSLTFKERLRESLRTASSRRIAVGPFGSLSAAPSATAAIASSTSGGGASGLPEGGSGGGALPGSGGGSGGGAAAATGLGTAAAAAGVGLGAGGSTGHTAGSAAGGPLLSGAAGQGTQAAAVGATGNAAHTSAIANAVPATSGGGAGQGGAADAATPTVAPTRTFFTTPLSLSLAATTSVRHADSGASTPASALHPAFPGPLHHSHHQSHSQSHSHTHSPLISPRYTGHAGLGVTLSAASIAGVAGAGGGGNIIAPSTSGSCGIGGGPGVGVLPPAPKSAGEAAASSAVAALTAALAGTGLGVSISTPAPTPTAAGTLSGGGAGPGGAGALGIPVAAVATNTTAASATASGTGGLFGAAAAGHPRGLSPHGSATHGHLLGGFFPGQNTVSTGPPPSPRSTRSSSPGLAAVAAASVAASPPMSLGGTAGVGMGSILSHAPASPRFSATGGAAAGSFTPSASAGPTGALPPPAPPARIHRRLSGIRVAVGSALDHGVWDSDGGWRPAEQLHDVYVPAHLQRISPEDLVKVRELGRGCFGSVWLARWRGVEVALKELLDQRGAMDGPPNEVFYEAERLASLRHPCIIAFYGIVASPGSYATVVEYLRMGSLKSGLTRLRKQGADISKRLRVAIALQAARGMEYLHGQFVVHFDLKCDNLLCDLRDPARPVVKIGDLGLSKKKKESFVSGNMRGTLPWMAPELFPGVREKQRQEATAADGGAGAGAANGTGLGLDNGVGHGSSGSGPGPGVGGGGSEIFDDRVNEKVDVFSFGVVLWEIWQLGEQPYSSITLADIFAGVMTGSLRPGVPPDCDPDWAALMQACWHANPRARPSFSEIAERLDCLLERVTVLEGTAGGQLLSGSGLAGSPGGPIAMAPGSRRF